MPKDFDGWNEKKKSIHDREQAPFFHEREVWWCVLGLNVGYEQDGGEKFARPMLVVKKFNKDVLWALPLTTSEKRDRYYVPMSGQEGSAVILSQLRLISSKRLERLMYKLPNGQFHAILDQVKQFFPRN
jgi:mRNA interferase MazF